jgi:hypothetical protein
MSKARRRLLEQRWGEAGLEGGQRPPRESVEAEQSPEDKLLQTATAVTIGAARNMTRWQIERTTSNRPLDCHNHRRTCSGYIYAGDEISIFTDNTGEIASPVLAHRRCEGDVLEIIGGQRQLTAKYPHEITFGESVVEIVGQDNSRTIDGFSGSPLEEKPLGRDDYVAYVTDQVLERLRGLKPELPGLKPASEAQ